MIRDKKDLSVGRNHGALVPRSSSRISLVSGLGHPVLFPISLKAPNKNMSDDCGGGCGGAAAAVQVFQPILRFAQASFDASCGSTLCRPRRGRVCLVGFGERCGGDTERRR